MSADTFAYQTSTIPQQDDFIMASRQFTWIGDSNGTSYPSGQIVFDLAGLSNSGKFIDWQQTNLVIPLVLNINATAGGAGGFGANPENVFAASFKNGWHHLINSMSVEITNNQVVNLTSFSNLDVNFRLLTKACYDDVLNFGPTFQFSKDNAESINFQGTPVGAALPVMPNGCGEYNNVITPVAFNPINGWGNTAQRQNKGRLERMNVTSYDPTQGSQPTFTTQAMCNNVGKATCINTAANITYYVLATIPLRMMHDIFRKIPLTMGMYMRLVINTNTAVQVQIGVQAAANGVAATYLNNMQVSSQNGVVPFMLSPIGVGNGFNPNAVTSITASLGIAKGYGTTANQLTNPILNQCRIYACMYDMSPSFANTYLNKNPVKRILYNDILSFQSINVLPGSVTNQILTNGVSRPRYLIGIPMLASSYVPSAALNIGGGCGYSPMNSPFSSAPGTTCPQARLTNFNVLLSGSNIYQEAYTYTFTSFLQELRQCNCLNGGLDLGISNGLISSSDYENGYGYVFVNLERKDSQASDDISRSVQVMFTNGSNVALDVFWVIGYSREISISTSTGTLVI